MPESSRRETLNAEDRQLVDLIAAGLTRWAIAQRLDLSENAVRTIVRRLCAQFNCPMRDLPAEVEKIK